jgi:hypothetical protein
MVKSWGPIEPHYDLEGAGLQPHPGLGLFSGS